MSAARYKRRAIALEQVVAARSALGAAVSDVLRARSARCSPGCRGWVVDLDEPSPRLMLCDPCASLSGYADSITDADVRAVPEAARALARASRSR